ncbi:MAG: YggS family pyridoxal phosphate-dependent enzyme [Candidatus Pelagibacterales bacterium]
MSIADNYHLIQESINKRLSSLSRSYSDIELVAVSKKQSKSKIIELLECGHRSFGENQIQEIESKWPSIRKFFPDVSLSFIGSIQSRKIKKICELCDVIHSVDREKIVKLISELKSQGFKIPKLFLQVNIGLENQKSGIHPDEVKEFLDVSLKKYDISFNGLMCLPPISRDPKIYFDQLNYLSHSNKIEKLSMGMSDDYLIALDSGATHIRVGSLIFGERV